MRLSEYTYNEPPRVTSSYSWSIYQELEKIAENIDFRHPRFINRKKRNRSLGSVQAFIVELALTDERFIQKLKRYMVAGGTYYVPTINYSDRYD